MLQLWVRHNTRYPIFVVVVVTVGAVAVAGRVIIRTYADLGRKTQKECLCWATMTVTFFLVLPPA